MRTVVQQLAIGVIAGLIVPTFIVVAHLLDSEPGSSGSPEDRSTPSFLYSSAVPSDASVEANVLLAAGDIAGCGSRSDEETALVLDGVPGLIATLGDNAYPRGTAREYEECFAPSWGRHKDRIRPVPGNHDYFTPGAAGYFGYFGPAAGEPGKGYYTYELNGWRIYALNSKCSRIGGCEAGSPQYRWLADQLKINRASCTLAYWHEPPFGAGLENPRAEAVRPWVTLLYEAGADIILSASAHNYQRLARLDPTGETDDKFGIRYFVVGTGGAGLHPVDASFSGLEVWNDSVHGILRLTLDEDGYTWQFLPADGEFTDAGTGECHEAPPA